MLFLSPGIVFWLQLLLHWCDNNTLFIVNVSRVYATSLLQKWGKKQNQGVDTHCISENFQHQNIRFPWLEYKISSSFFESFCKCKNYCAILWNFGEGKCLPGFVPVPSACGLIQSLPLTQMSSRTLVRNVVATMLRRGESNPRPST